MPSDVRVEAEVCYLQFMAKRSKVFLLVYFVAWLETDLYVIKLWIFSGFAVDMFFFKIPTQTEALLKRCFFVHHVFGAIEALLANLVEGAVEWQGGFLAKFSKYLESSSLVKNYGL